MNLKSSLQRIAGLPRRKLREWRLRRAAKRAAPLREFVYLDEVSLYSLLSSRIGAIATEFTRTQSEELRSEDTFQSSMGKGATLALGSKTERSRLQSSQVVRKTIVQSAFKEFREIESKLGLLSLSEPDGVSAGQPLVVRSAKTHLRADPNVISADKLSRGTLVELDVELRSDPIFQIGTVISTIMDILFDNADALRVDSRELPGEARSLSKLLEQLLSGLVPIKARLVGYEAVGLDGEWFVCPSATARALSSSGDVATLPIFLTAVAEEQLFWKDIRRLVFGSSTYRVLGRVAADGLLNDWSPIILAEALREPMPDFADFLDNLGLAGMEAMTAAGLTQDATSRGGTDDRASRTFANLAESVANYHGKEAHEAQGILLTARASSADFIEPLDHMAVRSIASRFLDELDSRWDVTTSMEVRRELLGRALLGAWRVSDTKQESQPWTGVREVNERYLNLELVAIYW